MDFLGKNPRLGLAAGYSMLRLLIEGAYYSFEKYYKKGSKENLNICLIIKKISNEFENLEKTKILIEE